MKRGFPISTILLTAVLLAPTLAEDAHLAALAAELPIQLLQANLEATAQHADELQRRKSQAEAKGDAPEAARLQTLIDSAKSTIDTGLAKLKEQNKAAQANLEAFFAAAQETTEADADDTDAPNAAASDEKGDRKMPFPMRVPGQRTDGWALDVRFAKWTVGSEEMLKKKRDWRQDTKVTWALNQPLPAGRYQVWVNYRKAPTQAVGRGILELLPSGNVGFQWPAAAPEQRFTPLAEIQVPENCTSVSLHASELASGVPEPQFWVRQILFAPVAATGEKQANVSF
jgi:hypothetical protein